MTNPNAVFNGSDDGYGASVVAISGTTPFDFLGAYFGTWTGDNYYNWYGATELTIYGIFESTLVATATFGLTPGPLSYHAFNNFNNIDTLQFVAYGNFLMDNFTTSGVPLPGALVLLGAGLVRLVAYGRRKKALP